MSAGTASPESELAPDALRVEIAGGGSLVTRASEPGVVTLLVAGDTVLSQADARQAAVRGTHPWEPMIDVISQHTWSVANVEAPITGTDAPIVKSGPHLRSTPGLAEVLKQGGFNAVSLANNHVLDMGPTGLSDTLRICDDAGLLRVGAGLNLREASAPLVLAEAGLSVAILALAEWEFSIATPEAPGAAPVRLVETVQMIRALAAQAETVVVLLHSGAEHYPLPSPGLVRRCHLLVDAGAKAVICHHSHVPSGAEVYRGAPIVYGTGNFLFPVAVPPTTWWHTGCAVSIRFGRGGAEDCLLVPHKHRTDSVGVEFLRDDEVGRFAARFAELSGTIADDVELGQRWQEHCRTAAPHYLATALGLTRVERRLVRMGVWPSWRFPHRRVPGLANLVRCETHREALVTLLEDEMGRSDG